MGRQFYLGKLPFQACESHLSMIDLLFDPFEETFEQLTPGFQKAKLIHRAILSSAVHPKAEIRVLHEAS